MSSRPRLTPWRVNSSPASSGRKLRSALRTWRSRPSSARRPTRSGGSARLAQHEVEQRRRLVDEVLRGSARPTGRTARGGRRARGRRGCPAGGQVLEDHVDQVVARLRRHVAQPGERAGPLQCHDDRSASRRGLVVTAVDASATPTGAGRRGVEPAGEQGGLARPGRTAYERDLAPLPVGEQASSRGRRTRLRAIGGWSTSSRQRGLCALAPVAWPAVAGWGL